MKQQIKLSPNVEITYGERHISELLTEWFVQWANEHLGRTVLEIKDLR